MPPGLRAATALLLGAVWGGMATVFTLPLARVGGFAWIAAGLVAVVPLATAVHPRLLAAPPAARSARLWLARGFRTASICAIAIGVRSVDAWHHAPETLRPPVAVAVLGLAAVGYLGVRLGATATAVRAARPVPPTLSPPPPAGGGPRSC